MEPPSGLRGNTQEGLAEVVEVLKKDPADAAEVNAAYIKLTAVREALKRLKS